MRDPVRVKHCEEGEKVCELCGSPLDYDPEEGLYHCSVCEERGE
jgi:hypothetical protein